MHDLLGEALAAAALLAGSLKFKGTLTLQLARRQRAGVACWWRRPQTQLTLRGVAHVRCRFRRKGDRLPRRWSGEAGS